MRKKIVAVLMICVHLVLLSGCYSPYDNGRGDEWDAGYKDGREDGCRDGYDEGYRDGYDEGYHEGIEDGYHEGIEDGCSDGYEEGYEDGYEEGYSRGELNGEDFVFSFMTDEMYAEWLRLYDEHRRREMEWWREKEDATKTNPTEQQN